jgi:glycosyltransferase involved in cell wall biosynthesis
MWGPQGPPAGPLVFVPCGRPKRCGGDHRIGPKRQHVGEARTHVPFGRGARQQPGKLRSRPRVPHLSVILPAFNEARALPATLAALDEARRHIQLRFGTDVLVVDNASTDATAEVARSAGARVVSEPFRNVARARNAGASAARGEVLVFVDADAWVPRESLEQIAGAMNDPRCIGGALGVLHRPRSRVLRAYLAGWRLLGRALRMSQGATQFCRRDAFDALAGYNERLWMGEDVELQWRLRRLARGTARSHRVIHQCRVVPSPRRFDQWPLWRTLVWTNPLVTMALARSARVWRKGWYETPPR